MKKKGYLNHVTRIRVMQNFVFSSQGVKFAIRTLEFRKMMSVSSLFWRFPTEARVGGFDK